MLRNTLLEERAESLIDQQVGKGKLRVREPKLDTLSKVPHQQPVEQRPKVEERPKEGIG